MVTLTNTKTILLLMLLVCIGAGYYAWQQQKASLRGLEQARSQGAKIDFFLYSRPLFALDSTHKNILLIYSDRTISVKFPDIDTIRFTETPESSPDNSNPRGPDTINIYLKDGQNYRIGDLKETAREAVKRFRSYAPEVESVLKHR